MTPFANRLLGLAQSNFVFNTRNFEYFFCTRYLIILPESYRDICGGAGDSKGLGVLQGHPQAGAAADPAWIQFHSKIPHLQAHVPSIGHYLQR